MNFILLLLSIFGLARAFSEGSPTRIIEIMTWDPDEDVLSKNDQESVKAHDNLRETLENTFKNGKRITESELAGFLKGLTEEDLLFFSPNHISAFDIAYARFEGLLAAKYEKKQSIVMEEIQDLRLRQVKAGEHSFFTPIDSTRYLDNSFRVLDYSLMLESGNFDCPSRYHYIGENKKHLPYKVASLCEFTLKEGTPDFSINAMMESLRKKDDKIFSRYTTREVESCLEAYTMSVYFATDLQIKLSSGSLISRILHDLADTLSSVKYHYYITTNEGFLALMTALHKVILSKNLVQPLNTIYWTSLYHFDKSIRIVKFIENGQEKVYLGIYGPSGQEILKLTFSYSVFGYELNAFAVTGFDEFKNLCEKPRDSLIDMRKMLFPSGFLSGFSSFGKFLIIGILVMILVALTLGMYSWLCKKKSEETKDIEFKEVKKSSDESLGEEDEEEIKDMRNDTSRFDKDDD